MYHNCHNHPIIKDGLKLTTCENMRVPYNHGSTLGPVPKYHFGGKKKRKKTAEPAFKIQTVWFITCKCCCRVTCRHSLISSTKRMSVLCLVTANSISVGDCSPSPVHMPRIGSWIPRYHWKRERFRYRHNALFRSATGLPSCCWVLRTSWDYCHEYKRKHILEINWSTRWLNRSKMLHIRRVGNPNLAADETSMWPSLQPSPSVVCLHWKYNFCIVLQV